VAYIIALAGRSCLNINKIKCSKYDYIKQYFMCHYEEQWLEKCPDQFKPVFYRRYVDDTFMLFRDASHVPLFQDYLNKKHDRIQFTCEIEKRTITVVSGLQNNQKFARFPNIFIH